MDPSPRLLLAILLLQAGCGSAPDPSSNARVLEDFEDPGAESRWDGPVSVSREYASHGAKALRAELTSESPRFGSAALMADWRGYDRLLFDVYIERDQPTTANLRIYDAAGGDWDRAPRDEYFEGRNKIFLQRGWSHVEVNLRPLKAATFERDIDLSSIVRFSISLDGGYLPAVLYLDNVRVAAGEEDARTRSRMEPANIVSKIDNRWVTAEQVSRPEEVPESVEVGRLRSRAEREAALLRGAIAAARTQGLETVYQERSLVVADVGLGVRPLLPWFNRDDRKKEMFLHVAESCRRSRQELDDLMRGALRRAETDDTQMDGPQIPPLPPLRERPANGWFFRGESGDPLMVLSLHSASAALQRFFATPLQHIESYTVGGGSRWTIDRSPVYAAFQADPGARRVGWDGWCGHLIRDLHSMGGTKKENVVICLEHPGIRQAISEYIRLNIPGLHANPELLYDIMAYELSYMCYCDRSRAMFYKWLGARHGTVADANGKWGTNYRSFADVTPPPVKDSRPLADTNRAVWYDWARFNMDRFTDHLLWVRQEIRRISPRIPLAAGGSSYMLSGHASTSGIDEERIVNEVDDLIIHEGGDSTMGLDLQLALSDTPKPLADPEMSLQGVEYLLPHFLHGKSVAQIYHWPAQPANEFYSNNSSSIAHGWRYSLADVDELLRVALDVRRLNREIASFVETPAEVAILYSQTSTIQIPAEMVTWRITPYLAEMRKVYQGSLHLDTRTTFITERQVLRGRLDRYKLVIVPGARNVPAGVAKRLWEYASNGGHVVVTPESLLGDEYNRPQPYLDPVGISILRTERPRGAGSGAMVQGYDQSFAEDVSFEAAPVETLVPAGPLDLGALQTEGVRQALAPAADLTVLYRFAGGDPAIVRRPFGQGVVTYVAASLQEQAYARLFDAIFDAARVVRPVRVRSASPLEARYATLHGRKLLSVINLASKPVDITVEAPVRALIELRGGRRFDGNRVTIPERQTYILELQEGTEQL